MNYHRCHTFILICIRQTYQVPGTWWTAPTWTKLAGTLLTLKSVQKKPSWTLRNRDPIARFHGRWNRGFVYGFKFTAPLNNRSNVFWHRALMYMGAVRFRWHSYGAVWCGFRNRWTYGAVWCGFQMSSILRWGSALFNVLRCGSVRCSEIVNLRCGSLRFSDVISTGRFGAILCPTMRFGAIWCPPMRLGAVFWYRKTCGAVRSTAPNRTEPLGKIAP